MDLRDHRVSIVTFSIIFLFLYLPIMGKPLSFEELRLTPFFHSVPPLQVKTFNPELINGSRFAQHWRQYIQLNPPGLMAFYYIWSRLSFGDEIFMRIPLLLLMLLCLRNVYGLLKDWFSKSEAALLLLLLGLFPLWYRHGTTLNPESFNFYFIILSVCYYAKAFKENCLKSPSLWLVNIFGLFNSYLFIFVILGQTLGSLINNQFKYRRQFAGVFIALSLVSILSFIFIPQHNANNPHIFYWGNLDGSEVLEFLEYTILGQIRL